MKQFDDSLFQQNSHKYCAIHLQCFKDLIDTCDASKVNANETELCDIIKIRKQLNE